MVVVQPLTAPLIAFIVLTGIGLLLCFAAIATPAWQVVYAREIEQWVQSGLWLNCQTRPNGMYACVYTFTEGDFNFYTHPDLNHLRSPAFFSWQRYLFWGFLAGQFLAVAALIALPLACQQGTQKAGALLSAALLSAGILLHTICIVAFMFISQMVEYRFYHVSVSGIYEKQRGYSFFIELIGLPFLVLALICVVWHFVRVNASDDSERLPPNDTHHFTLSDTDKNFSDYDDDRSWEAKFAMRELPPVPTPTAPSHHQSYQSFQQHHQNQHQRHHNNYLEDYDADGLLPYSRYNGGNSNATTVGSRTPSAMTAATSIGGGGLMTSGAGGGGSGSRNLFFHGR